MTRQLLFMVAMLSAALVGTSVRAAEQAAAPKSADTAKSSDEEDKAEKSKSRGIADRIPPVSGHMFLKKGRFEASPTVSASLADAFFQKYGVGLKLDFHASETLSFGVHGSYDFNTVSGVINTCPDSNGDGVPDCRAPTMQELDDVPGKITWMAGANVAYAPIYGKVNVLAEKVLHFDLYGLAGVSALQYQTPNAGSSMGFGAHLGVGQRYFVSRSTTLRIELRDYIYSAQTVPLSNSDKKIENQLMFELGLSFFLGGSPQE